MFKKINLILICLVMPTLAFAFCDKCEPVEKIYVQVEDLAFDGSKILYRNGINSIFEEAESLHVDSLGYYVAKSDNLIDWKCPRCGYANRSKRPYNCANCSWPYDDKR